MKEVKKLTAQDWVLLAKTYGEDCIKIQRNQSLCIDEKLAAQSKLTGALVEKIKSDPDLTDKDKQEMAASVENYMNEWKKLGELLKKEGDHPVGEESKSSHKSDKSSCCKHSH